MGDEEGRPSWAARLLWGRLRGAMRSGRHGRRDSRLPRVGGAAGGGWCAPGRYGGAHPRGESGLAASRLLPEFAGSDTRSSDDSVSVWIFDALLVAQGGIEPPTLGFSVSVSQSSHPTSVYAILR